jgi:hypothetical protein
MNCPADERFRRTCLTVVKCTTGFRGEKDSWWRKVPVVKGDEVERKEPELTAIGNLNGEYTRVDSHWKSQW